MVKIKIDLERYAECGTCVDVRPVGAFKIENEKSTVENVDDPHDLHGLRNSVPNEAIKSY